MVMIGKQESTKLEKVIDIISTWGGQLIEPSYTAGISSTTINESLKEINNSDLRRSKLRS